jgi:hypothetical protein
MTDHQSLIDLRRLEAHFQQIGIDKIPHFISLYLQNYSNLITRLRKYNSRSSKKKLSELLHKFRGSTANFFCYDFDQILLEIEKKITYSTGAISEQDIQNLQSEFADFCRSLKELAENYHKAGL